MLIWIASYPRSGNSFFRALIKHVYQMPTYETYERDRQGAPALDRIMGARSPTQSLAEMHASKECFFIKTHELPIEDYPSIYLVRDGRDALVSHTHYVLDYDRGIAFEPARFGEALRSLIERQDSFGGWGRHVHEWTHRTTPTVVVKFEDLIHQPLQHLRHAMAAIEMRLPEIDTRNLPDFKRLHNELPTFFRRGRVGGWRDEMPKDLQKLFWQRHGKVMQEIGYQRTDRRDLTDNG